LPARLLAEPALRLQDASERERRDPGRVVVAGGVLHGLARRRLGRVQAAHGREPGRLVGEQERAMASRGALRQPALHSPLHLLGPAGPEIGRRQQVPQRLTLGAVATELERALQVRDRRAVPTLLDQRAPGTLEPHLRLVRNLGIGERRSFKHQLLAGPGGDRLGGGRKGGARIARAAQMDEALPRGQRRARQRGTMTAPALLAVHRREQAPAQRGRTQREPIAVVAQEPGDPELGQCRPGGGGQSGELVEAGRTIECGERGRGVAGGLR
jgi:hypothetical protein